MSPAATTPDDQVWSRRIWVLTNWKPAHRQGKVQLIDATEWFKPLPRNLGKKNCEFTDEHTALICEAFLGFKEGPNSKIFTNEAFGYWKVRVERPLRLRSQITRKAVESLRFSSGDEEIRASLYDTFSEALFEDFGSVRARVEKALAKLGRLGAGNRGGRRRGGRRRGAGEERAS
jgi:type I restriction enzyme M protein